MKKLITIFALILLISCGTRNTKKTEIKEEDKKEISTEKEEKTSEETNKKTDSQTKIDFDIVDHEENLEPIDPLKPIVKTVEEKDGKKTTTWKNAKVINKSKADNSKIVNLEKAVETVKKEVQVKTNTSSSSKTSKKSFDKETTRKTISYWWLLLLLSIPAYFGYRKYKEKIWFI